MVVFDGWWVWNTVVYSKHRLKNGCALSSKCDDQGAAFKYIYNVFLLIKNI